MKSPAFQFYVQDFLIGTSDFTAEEVGGYIRLLAHQWDKGSVPDDDRRLIQLTGAKAKSLQVIRTKFVTDGIGQMKNERLEKERAKQIEWRAKSAAAGIKSGEARRNQMRTKHEPTIEPNGNQTRTLQSSSSSSEKVVEDQKDLWFQAFRRAAGAHINNEDLGLEIGKFRNRYPNTQLNAAGALINTWISNIGRTPPKSKINV